MIRENNLKLKNIIIGEDNYINIYIELNKTILTRNLDQFTIFVDEKDKYSLYSVINYKDFDSLDPYIFLKYEYLSSSLCIILFLIEEFKSIANKDIKKENIQKLLFKYKSEYKEKYLQENLINIINTTYKYLLDRRIEELSYKYKSSPILFYWKSFKRINTLEIFPFIN